MFDWENDEFLSSWDRTYVSTNVKLGCTPFDLGTFSALMDNLNQAGPDMPSISYCIIAVSSCAVGRADIVGRLFDHLTTALDPEESEVLFLRIREALTIVYPFLGMPCCIPACYGIIGVIQRKGPEYASNRVLRAATVTEEDNAKGKELRRRIYSSAGNSDIFRLMEEYFADLFTCSTAVTWGYLISKANEQVFAETHSHLIVTSAIIALGAARQARSHVKATIGIGNDVKVVKAVVNVVLAIAEWAGKSIQIPDVDECAEQVYRDLRKQRE
ncbi:hypothetical protein CNMCM8980_004503 [Aspergillus fumigatiaffinis]|uniref:Carboxymuconolactone decarboxylase-like domain-containing protein n=1 Tax=Aspergillus fumigatiaffinis TaxID=340414 RepID=A0A8H4EBJ7_9EURO|nr:hypothetical protein CNMCM6457_003644 [Aspergillus fumigatiaffinis]KAF4221687.1 hypothetical protein CNMCM5878_008111 [Aspergillus fumigatiaffinis]KAF4221805.1 hypothetical protein CNMCM5878_008229 [Aspergillus fumigatiaffinis]KAF4226578.1 hypothetical protein CNMCM6805_004375 [Aspergillus fumigatiaffinis]KAF4233169.1 hypothetical protein CNMCM8980_004503 [Aspergillus fumigatiaffinis]